VPGVLECTSAHLSTHDRPADAGPLLRRGTAIWEPVRSKPETGLSSMGNLRDMHPWSEKTLPVFTFNLLFGHYNQLNPNFPSPDRVGTACSPRVSWILDAIAAVLQGCWI
jgi:hypothetical protein